MKKILLATILFSISFVSLQASEITTEADLKKAIAKLIIDKASLSQLNNININVEKNKNDIMLIKKKLSTFGQQKKSFNFQKGVVSNCWFLHLRKEPSEKSPIRGFLKKGETINIVKSNNNGWFSVMTKEGSGWVSGRYLSNY